MDLDGYGDEEDEEEMEEEKGELEDDNENQGNKAEKIKNLCTLIYEKYPIDIFKEEGMKILKEDYGNLKVRVYLISAQNLTATGTKIDLKSRLAGMTALTTATPYPVIKVGDSKGTSDS